MKTNKKSSLQNVSERASKLRTDSSKALKKTIAATMVFSTLSFNSVFASDKDDSSKLNTVYHVYLNNKYLGTVSNKGVINKVIDEKLDQFKLAYESYNLSLGELGEEITYIPEEVFRPTNTNNEQIAQTIRDQLQIKVEAVAIKVDGKVVGFVESREKAEEVIKQLKLKYVSEEDLKKLEELEKKKLAGEELPPLKENESRILDVHLSANVTLSLDKTLPNQILSVKDTVKLLQRGTLEEKKYKVQEGDVLGSIAQKHNLKLKQLLDLNPGIKEDTLLQIGQELNVTAYEPYVKVLITKEVHKNEKISYKTEYVNDSSMFKGDTKVKQEGQEGQKSVTYLITESSGVQTKKEVVAEKVLKDPVNKIILKGTKVVPSRGTGSLAWPTIGGYISSYQGYRWGRLHKGIDIARPSDYSILAADNGTVVFAGWDGAFGNKIIIDHNNGVRTLYAHLSSINVYVGQTVSKGSRIGIMGSTGDSTGTHLHFEVYKNGQLQNPLSYLN